VKKSYPFNIMSTRKCNNCSGLLKKRMVEEHNATVCWKCVKMFMRMWGLGRIRTLHRLQVR